MLNHFSNVKSQFWLNRYLSFVKKFKLDNSIKGLTHDHHILPSSLFPEFKNLTEHGWNKAILPIRAHYLAHFMLSKALGGKMWYAWNNMNSKRFNIKFNSNLYAAAMLEFSKIERESLVLCRNIETGEYRRVSKEVFERDANLVGPNHGKNLGADNPSKRVDVRKKISAKRIGKIPVTMLSSDKIFYVSPAEYNKAIHIIHSPWKGKKSVVVVDKDGNRFSVGLDDPRYISGELISPNTGRKYKSTTLFTIKLNETINIIENHDNLKKFCIDNNISYSTLYRKRNATTAKSFLHQ